jgi:hypothetical protein
MRLKSGVMLVILASCIFLCTSRLPKFPTPTMNEKVDENDS